MAATMTGLNKVQARLQALAQGLKKSPKIMVGYSAAYAKFVHENLQVFHKNGQAKFLEQPARTLVPEMSKIVVGSLKGGESLEQSMLNAGQFLLAQSQALVPVLTGHLRDSGYVKVE